jgi:hypothetical protein
MDGSEITEIRSSFFVELIADILRFFESGVTSFERDETREVMRLRNAALVAAENPNEWIELDSI